MRKLETRATILAHWLRNAEQTILRLMARPALNSDPQVLDLAERLQALPVGWDLWSHWFLRPSGEVVVADIEMGTGEISVFKDRVRVLSAIVMGREKYAELAELLPTRQPTAIDCGCKDRLRAKVICGTCGGIGWQPAQTP